LTWLIFLFFYCLSLTFLIFIVYYTGPSQIPELSAPLGTLIRRCWKKSKVLRKKTPVISRLVTGLHWTP